MSDEQSRDDVERDQWQRFGDKFGYSDNKREMEVVRRLRELADHIEGGKYPRVYTCSLPDRADWNKELGLVFEVILSHPWPG